jgi:stage II sporulation protein D
MFPRTDVRHALKKVALGLVAVTTMSPALLAPLPARADSIQDQLAALQAQEAGQKATLGQLNGQQASARAILDQLHGDLGSKQSDYGQVLAQAQDLDDRIKGFEAQENTLQTEHDIHVQSFALEVRTLYKAGPGSWLTFIFSAGSFSELLDRLVYLTRQSRADYEKAQQLKAEREALAAQREKTAQLRAALAPLLQELAQKMADAQNAFDAQASVTSDLEARQRAQLAALRGTQNKERELEAALAAAEAAANAAAQKGNGRSYGPVCPAAPAGLVSICGHGWGHGVGLAQYGALGMAQAGMSWPQIIGNFYSGTYIGGVPNETVRVFLTGAGRTVTPRGSSATIQDTAGNNLGSIGQDQGVNFTPNGDGSVSASWPGGSASGRPLRLVPSGGIFQVSGTNRRYRGDAWADNSSGFRIVNHVDTESYLQGLSEVPSSWPLNAIEAQIVAARTYALYHLGGGAYDLDDGTNSQVYNGVDRETAAQNAAVNATRGQGIFYQGSIISAVYSSSDGGHTQCASAVWGNGDNPCTPPYLRGVIDNYDVSPLHTWYTPPHTWAQIQAYLGSTYNAGACGSLTGLDLSDRDASKRLNHVRMVGTSGTCTVTPGAFIRAINAGSPADFIVYGDMFGTTPGNRAWPYW